MARIIEAIRRVPLPGLPVTVQPANRTLVNADTILYTQPAPVHDTIDILGYRVRIEATAATYTWTFGDHTTETTTNPGAPYPHQTVTHRYQHTADAMPISVTVNYTVHYSIDGDPWELLDGHINATGPTTTIGITEAHAVLTTP